MRQPHRFGRSAASATLTTCILLLALTACTPPGKDPSMTNNPTMTPGDAVAEVQTLLDSAQTAIGGHWESRESGAEDCALPDGTTGARFALGATGPGLPTAELTAAVASVTSAWSDAGFPPVVKELAPVNGVTATQVSYPESGEGVDGLYLRLRITESGSALDAQTRCVPGDSAQING